MKRFLYWTPRILGIVMAGFTSIFALDVFDQGLTGGELIIPLAMHLLPTFIMILFISVAWNVESPGGWLFIALGGAYLFMNEFEVGATLTISLPLIIIGALFLTHYYKYVKKGVPQATVTTPKQ